MANYKPTEKGQSLLLAVNLSDQIISGTFEHTMQKLIDNKLDLRIFDYKYKNDITGAPAINPRILLKIIIFCYSIGIIGSRKIAKLCKHHILVKALAEDTEPHHTTISDFISGMDKEIEIVFTEVLLVCDAMGLIKGKMFAVDGCKLPSNASKEYSGTKEELQEKYNKLKKLSRKILEKHKNTDRVGKKELEADTKKLERLEKKAQKIYEFLQTHEDRKGVGGEIIQSNLTDNESGKIKCSHGVIQGYNGIAVADNENQVIVAANAYGTVAEGQFFAEMLNDTEKNMKLVTGKKKPLKGAIMLGDTAYFSEDNLQAAKKKEVEAIIPDAQFRNRDDDLKDGKRREGKEKLDIRYFHYVKKGNYFVCPNKKILIFKGRVKLNRNVGYKYQSKASDCAGCPYADRCFHTKKKIKKCRTLYIPNLSNLYS